MKIIDFDFVKNLFPKRNELAHKGDFGRTLIVAGSYGMAGAAAIAGESCVKSGVGICHIFCPDSIYPIVATRLPEAVYTPYGKDFKRQLATDISKSDCVAIGCGCGWTNTTSDLLMATLEHSHKTLIIDADGLNCLSEDLSILKSCDAKIILTPHLGEMSRLCGMSVKEILANRLDICKEFAQTNNVVLVLKGYDTLVTLPNGEQYVNMSGNAGMATGGSGDMLCGIMSALCCQMSVEDAVISAVFIHGMAGDLCAAKYSQTSTCPTLMIESLPEIYKLMEEA